MAKELSGAGLRGQIAGKTSLSTVGSTGHKLTYRGYPIEVLAEKAEYEEVVLLLTRGELPTEADYTDFMARFKGLRELPSALCDVLEKIPADAAPMDVMRTGVSFLGVLEPEADHSEQLAVSDRIVATLPGILLYWHNFHTRGKRIETHSDESNLAAHFIRLLHSREPEEAEIACMNTSLILYAEHEFNASTFTARICASTLSDMYSCVTAAIGSLKGPLHGGANEFAMDLIEKFSTPAEANEGILQMLEKKEKIMGFGHAIYSDSDPRSAIIEDLAEKLIKTDTDRNTMLVAREIRDVMWSEKNLFTNADFFHAPAYRFLQIPTPLFTPIFVCGRAAGWTSHVIEQRSDNRIIRPSAEYIGETYQEWVDRADR